MSEFLTICVCLRVVGVSESESEPPEEDDGEEDEDEFVGGVVDEPVGGGGGLAVGVVDGFNVVQRYGSCVGFLLLAEAQCHCLRSGLCGLGHAAGSLD